MSFLWKQNLISASNMACLLSEANLIKSSKCIFFYCQFHSLLNLLTQTISLHEIRKQHLVRLSLFFQIPLLFNLTSILGFTTAKFLFKKCDN